MCDRSPTIMATTLIEDAATVNGDVALAPSIRNDSTTENDVEVAQSKETPDVVDELDWDNSPHNPFNWPARKKVLQVVMISSAAFLA